MKALKGWGEQGVFCSPSWSFIMGTEECTVAKSCCILPFKCSGALKTKTMRPFSAPPQMRHSRLLYSTLSSSPTLVSLIVAEIPQNTEIRKPWRQCHGKFLDAAKLQMQITRKLSSATWHYFCGRSKISLNVTCNCVTKLRDNKQGKFLSNL